MRQQIIRWLLTGLVLVVAVMVVNARQMSEMRVVAPAPLPQTTPDPSSGGGGGRSGSGGASETVQQRGRVNSSADSSAAIFTTDEGGVVIYSPDGVALVSVSGAALANLPDAPARNMLIAASDDRKVRLYRLTTGEYQVNVGPDESGNVRVTIFDGIPPTRIYNRDFNVYDILGR